MITSAPHRSRSPFSFISEWDDDFLALFPHRYDYIWAERPQPGQRPVWKTEKRHPLSDRLIRQGKYLYGVRFGQVTNYLLIDLDAKSHYHPNRDPLARDRLLATLEPLGLVEHLACTSSYSGGIHLYFPFEEAQNSYQLADAVTTVLTNAGFAIAPGQLELFPNTKLYVTDGEPSLFNAHRLPLQEPGSYLLNRDGEPAYTSQRQFVKSWCFAQRRNNVTSDVLAHILKTQKRSHYRLSTNAAKFLADLDSEIEPGWSGPGQTNHIFGRIAMREYVFHHLVHGGKPLAGQDLIDSIVSTARSLPGFNEWCRHQDELEQKAAEWARSVEASHYYPYGHGGNRATSAEPKPSWNQRQSAAARKRIQGAIAELLNTGVLPNGITARRKMLVGYGISQSTRSKHVDLWHPDHLSDASTNELHPEAQALEDSPTLEPLSNAELQPAAPNKLWGFTSGPAPLGQGPEASDFEVGGTGGISTDFASDHVAVSQSQIAAARALVEQRQAEAHAARMQQYLESGDPILIKEAQLWLAALEKQPPQ